MRKSNSKTLTSGSAIKRTPLTKAERNAKRRAKVNAKKALMKQEGSNLDQRQTLFLSYYLDPKSPTFENALRSALKAGYAQEYSENITSQMPDWLSDRIGEMRRSMMLKKAERNLIKGLDVDYEQDGEINDQLYGKVMQVSQFVTERLGKEFYSTRSEHTGKDGGAIQVNMVDPNQL